VGKKSPRGRRTSPIKFKLCQTGVGGGGDNDMYGKWLLKKSQQGNRGEGLTREGREKKGGTKDKGTSYDLTNYLQSGYGVKP